MKQLFTHSIVLLLLGAVLVPTAAEQAEHKWQSGSFGRASRPIWVDRSSKALQAGRGDLWDSGKVPARQFLQAALSARCFQSPARGTVATRTVTAEDCPVVWTSPCLHPLWRGIRGRLGALKEFVKRFGWPESMQVLVYQVLTTHHHTHTQDKRRLPGLRAESFLLKRVGKRC